MKKIFFILIISVLISGCSNGSGGIVNEKSTSVGGTSDTEVLKRINEINNGATPKVPPKKSSASKPPVPPLPSMSNTNKPKEVQLEDLTGKYKSAVLKTNLGDITLEFYAKESPITVNNFLNLAQDGFYDGTRFHRVISDFMIQGGDPQSKDLLKKEMWGMGGPDYKFQDEFNERPLQKGSLAMANSGPNTNGSQFFIVTADFTPWLDGKHTNFGYVTSGMDVVGAIEAVDVEEPSKRPKNEIVIESVILVE